MNCPVCGIYLENDSFVRVYMSSYNKQEYKLYYCNGCDLQFWSPLRIIPEFYESEVFAFYEGFHTGLSAKISYNHMAFFNYLPLRKGRLLDVGCGNGVFLKEAQRTGFEVYGIDFDKKSVETAKSQFGLANTFAMSLDEFIAWCPNQQFDIITIFEVLEHQDNPKDFIEKLRKLLKPGGYIAGSVPNRERVFADKDRSALGIDYPPHHFLWFNKNSLSVLLQSQGFRSIEVYYIKSLQWLASYLGNLLIGHHYAKLHRQLIQALLKLDYRGMKKSVKGGSYTTNLSTFGLNVLKELRNAALMPLAICVLPVCIVKGKWGCLYFQCKV